MGIFLIGIVLLIVCIICGIWSSKSWKDTPLVLAITSGLLCALAMMFSIPAGICCQVTKQNDYERVLYEKSVLEYRLENEINVVGNEMLYNDIVEFNQELRSTKYWSKNFWTNWYNNDLVENIEYIKIDDIVPKDFK